LSFFAVDIRYPDEFYIPSFNETKEYLKLAREVKSFVIKKLNLRNFDIKENKNEA